MDIDVIRHELEQPGAQELLTTAPLLRLAYTGSDGTPRVVPIGFLWTGRGSSSAPRRRRRRGTRSANGRTSR
jgi:hypothetical protein